MLSRIVPILGLVLPILATPATGQSAPPAPAILQRLLVESYPAMLSAGAEGGVLVAGRTSIPIGPPVPGKSRLESLDRADIADMFRDRYRAGPAAGPSRSEDPGRARAKALFDAMYGDCAKGEVERNLVEVVWLPRKSGQRLKVTRVNGVAERLAAVSAELDALPARFDAYLIPSAGTYNCRPVAGTQRASAHGWGIAIDIALTHAHYWRWPNGGKVPAEGGVVPYRNAIPGEIVEIFERHGFIWGGRWYHYDTMHFEYRPEIIAAGRLP